MARCLSHPHKICSKCVTWCSTCQLFCCLSTNGNFPLLEKRGIHFFPKMSTAHLFYSLPFCAGVQFFYDSIHEFNNQIKIRENLNSLKFQEGLSVCLSYIQCNFEFRPNTEYKQMMQHLFSFQQLPCSPTAQEPPHQ